MRRAAVRSLNQCWLTQLSRSLALKRFNERVLRWLARLDEVKFYSGSLRPKEHRLASEFWAVVHDNGSRQPSTICKLIQAASDAQTGGRSIDELADAGSRIIIHDV